MWNYTFLKQEIVEKWALGYEYMGVKLSIVNGSCQSAQFTLGEHVAVSVGKWDFNPRGITLWDPRTWGLLSASRPSGTPTALPCSRSLVVSTQNPGCNAKHAAGILMWLRSRWQEESTHMFLFRCDLQIQRLVGLSRLHRQHLGGKHDRHVALCLLRGERGRYQACPLMSALLMGDLKGKPWCPKGG